GGAWSPLLRAGGGAGVGVRRWVPAGGPRRSAGRTRVRPGRTDAGGSAGTVGGRPVRPGAVAGGAVRAGPGRDLGVGGAGAGGYRTVVHPVRLPADRPAPVAGLRPAGPLHHPVTTPPRVCSQVGAVAQTAKYISNSCGVGRIRTGSTSWVVFQSIQVSIRSGVNTPPSSRYSWSSRSAASASGNEPGVWATFAYSSGGRSYRSLSIGSGGSILLRMPSNPAISMA